jgi:hypothetical protein
MNTPLDRRMVSWHTESASKENNAVSLFVSCGFRAIMHVELESCIQRNVKE